MKIKINGKIYELNTNITFGLMMKLQDNSEDMRVMAEAFQEEILNPSPTDEEIKAFRRKDFNRIMLAFNKEVQDEIAKLKKKR